jgi:hypothetical protein
MPVAPSVNDLVDQGLAEAEDRRPDLLFSDGDVALAEIHAGAAMADATIRFGAQAFKATFIDLAEGDDLTALVDDHLNLQRQAATAASVAVTFTRTSSGAGGTIPAGTVVASVIGADGGEVRFELDNAIAVGAANNGPFAGTATCTATGRDGNVAIGGVSRIIDALFDTTFSVTNAAAGAGGNEQESDPQLRQRARTFWATLRRGTLAALEFGALTVASVRTARATEDATGLVTVLVADEDGNSNAQMVVDVEVALESWRAAGVVVTVIGGTKLAVGVQAYLILRDGVALTPLVTPVSDAITAQLAKQRQGEVLYLYQIVRAILDVDTDGIESVQILLDTTGAGSFGAGADFTPTSAQTIRVGALTVDQGPLEV